MPRHVAPPLCIALLVSLAGCTQPPREDSPASRGPTLHTRPAVAEKGEPPRRSTLEPGQSDHLTEPDGDVIAITYTGSSGKAVVSAASEGATIAVLGPSDDSQLRVRVMERGTGGMAFVPTIDVQGETVGSILVQGDIGCLRGGRLGPGAQISTMWPSEQTEGTIGELHLGRVDGEIRTKGMRKDWNLGPIGPKGSIRIGDRAQNIRGECVAKGLALRIAGDVEGDIDLNCDLLGAMVISGDVKEGSTIRMNSLGAGPSIAGERKGKVGPPAGIAKSAPPAETGIHADLLRAALEGDVGKAKRLIAEGASVRVRGRWGRTPLHEAAAMHGGLPMIRLLVESGADVNARDNKGVTPLAELAFGRKSDEAEFLISRAADVNVKGTFGMTPLHNAAGAGDLDLVKLMIAKGADVNAKDDRGETPLHEAAESGRDAVVEVLLQYGADMRAKTSEGETPADRAARRGRTSTFEIFRRKGAALDLHGAAALGDMQKVKDLLGKKADVNAHNAEGETPLHIAAGCGHTEIAELLIRKGASVAGKDRSGKTPLHRAARAGRKETADLLIRKGADVKAADAHGATPLHEAAAKGSADVAQLLIDKGADANARDSRGATPLACMGPVQDSRCIELLVANGADVDVRGVFGQTPLHQAVRNGSIDLVKLLVEKGADVNARSRMGDTPLSIAQRFHRSDIAEFLVSHGADARFAVAGRRYAPSQQRVSQPDRPDAVTPGEQLFGLPPAEGAPTPPSR